MAALPMLAERLFNRPLLAKPSYAQTVASVLAHRLDVLPVLAESERDIVRRPARDPMLTKDGVFVLPVVGGLYHRGDSLDAMSGAESYTHLNNQLLTALEDKDVRGILLDIDSPGGEATGCFEFADTLLEARKRKPIYAVANGMACSAAYAIGSSAQKFFVTPSGEVGSIGVCLMHRDLSSAMKQMGVVVTYIYAGKHKVDGNPFEPLPDAVKADLQEAIDARYSDFVAMVAARRPMTTKQIRATEARCFPAAAAVELGLADEVASFEVALKALTEEVNPVLRVSPNGAVSRMSNPGTPAAPVATGARIEGLEQALERARADGMATAQAAAEKQITEAYLKGRTDAAAILQNAAAEGRTQAAAQLAGNGKFGVEEAVALLATMPQESGGSSFRKSLIENDPPVRADNPAARAPANPVSDFQADVGRHIRARLGVKEG